MAKITLEVAEIIFYRDCDGFFSYKTFAVTRRARKSSEAQKSISIFMSSDKSLRRELCPIPVNTKHLYNISTTSADVAQMLNKWFVFAEMPMKCSGLLCQKRSRGQEKWEQSLFPSLFLPSQREEWRNKTQHRWLWQWFEHLSFNKIIVGNNSEHWQNA